MPSVSCRDRLGRDQLDIDFEIYGYVCHPVRAGQTLVVFSHAALQFTQCETRTLMIGAAVQGPQGDAAPSVANSAAAPVPRP